MSVEPNKWGVIYNPKAGTRKVQKRWKEIKAYMDSKGVSYDYVQSEGFGSVERLAGILANNGYRTIVIVGGDGALNDAINGSYPSVCQTPDDLVSGNGEAGIYHPLDKRPMAYGRKDSLCDRKTARELVSLPVIYEWSVKDKKCDC